MKTRTVFPTLLALVIQMMMMGQNQSSAPHQILPVLGTNGAIRQSASDKLLDELKKAPTLVKELKRKASEMPDIDNNTFNYYNDPDCYNSPAYSSVLLTEAEQLEELESELRATAAGRPAEDVLTLFRTADGLAAQAELKRIQASEIRGQISFELFRKNAKVYESLSMSANIGGAMLYAADEINSEAKRQMRMAREMREEAYAMPNNATKLGSMSNAEEKEFIALNKQSEAIGILRQYAALVASFENSIAMK